MNGSCYLHFHLSDISYSSSITILASFLNFSGNNINYEPIPIHRLDDPYLESHLEGIPVFSFAVHISLWLIPRVYLVDKFGLDALNENVEVNPGIIMLVIDASSLIFTIKATSHKYKVDDVLQPHFCFLYLEFILFNFKNIIFMQVRDQHFGFPTCCRVLFTLGGYLH
ncbi:hypothetical protein ACJX0J_026504 [Zea mays]